MFNNIIGDLKAYSKKVSLLNFLYLIFFNAGFLNLFLFRIYSYLYKKPLPLKIISKIIQRLHELLTACYISPKAKIDVGLRLPHPVGIVIGDGAVLGKNITIYQGVTLGKGTDNGYPLLQDDCIIFANSVLIGGIKLSNKCTIGANSFVNKDIPESSVFAGVPAKFIAYKRH